MTYPIIRTATVLSLAGIVMFGAAAPALAQGNKEWAHQHAPGLLKQLDENLSLHTAEFKFSSSSAIHQQASINHNGVQASQVIENGNSQIKQEATIAKKPVTTSQSIKTGNTQIKQQTAIQGSNGTIKVGEYVLGGGPDGNPGNKPHLPCKFEIEAYGFDAGVKKVQYVITSQAPTQPKFEVITSGSFTLDKDSNTFGGSDRGYDGKVVLDLSEMLKNYSAHDKQGHHLKIEVTFDGQPSHAGKHKVFWVEKCTTEEQGGGTITPTPTPQDNGQVSSIKTDKPSTGVMGTSIERGGTLPFTGGFGGAMAQALGLFLMVVGGIAYQVRKVQAEIAAQMSV